MTLAPEQRSKMLASTAEASIALVEDLEHLRVVVGTLDPTSGELRRISAILRRLLVERDLSLVATPRIGKIALKAPDNNPIYRLDRTTPLAFFSSGGAVTFGVRVRAGIVTRGSSSIGMPDFNPESFIELSLDGFLNQRVLCLNGAWVSRRALIKYMANTASGVHSGTPTTEEEKLISRMRAAATFSGQGEAMGLSFDHRPIEDTAQLFSPRPGTVDAVLVELLCAAHFLLESKSVTDLETAVRSEFSLPPYPANRSAGGSQTPPTGSGARPG